MHQKDKSSDSKVKLRQASNRCKRVLEAAKLAYANETKESITSQKIGSRDFCRISNSVLNKGKSAIPSKTNLKLHNIYVTPKMVKKVIINLDLSQASDPDCIPVLALKNCESGLFFILAELLNKCLKESSFPDCWKISSVILVIKNVGERSTAKNYCPVSLLSVVSKGFEKLVNTRVVDHLEKNGFFSDFQYGFRSS